DLDREARHQVLERVLPRVDREPRDEPVERRQEHEALRAERDALGLEAEAGGPEARLMEGDAFEHRRGGQDTMASCPFAGVSGSLRQSRRWCSRSRSWRARTTKRQARRAPMAGPTSSVRTRPGRRRTSP